MKILHLPHNIASIPYYTIKALSKKNTSCKSIFINPSKYHKYPDNNTTIIEIDSKNKIKRIANKLHYFSKIIELVEWADIVHWTFGYNVNLFKIDIDLKVIKKSKKPSLIEWMGSDIRIYEIEKNENIYYRDIFNAGYEYALFEKEVFSKSRQKKFAKNGFEFAVIKGLEKFVDSNIKNSFYITDLRICLDEFPVFTPRTNISKPLIVHSPSATVAKGTEFVLKVISNLKKRYEFDFVLISGEGRERNFEILKNADIYLDQFILGHYGMAAVEAMAFGKPVLCYLKDNYYGENINNIPIINTKVENLEEKISILIENPDLRQKIGQKSREFVNLVHNADIWADEFIKIYSQMLKK